MYEHHKLGSFPTTGHSMACGTLRRCQACISFAPCCFSGCLQNMFGASIFLTNYRTSSWSSPMPPGIEAWFPRETKRNGNECSAILCNRSNSIYAIHGGHCGLVATAAAPPWLRSKVRSCLNPALLQLRVMSLKAASVQPSEPFGT